MSQGYAAKRTTRRMARDAARKNEEGVPHPGQIKETVIRETRAADYAKKMWARSGPHGLSKGSQAPQILLRTKIRRGR
jgi:hypothetical protein